MYREVSKLILYRDLGEDSILLNMADIFKRFDSSCHIKAVFREENYAAGASVPSVAITELTN